MLAFLTGSGLYDHDDLAPTTIDTPHGAVRLFRGTVNGRDILMLPRHGEGHAALPHQIPHRAHLTALAEAGATAVISCSVCGVLNPDFSLGAPFVANDVYFPENRLGDGSACTLFQTPGQSGRGHLLAESLVHADLADAVANATGAEQRGVYAHQTGPRFNTKVEIRALRRAGVDFLSQTCGPEAVLANELELPWALAGFAIDYANGVAEEPTPIDVLNQNLENSRESFLKLIHNLREPAAGFPFTNFVYRFE